MAGQGSARPLCQVSNPMKIDPGTSVRHCTPKPAPVAQHLVRNRCKQITVGALVFNEDQLIGFLDSVAHAKVAEKHIKMVWKDYDESTVLNIIYSIPGMGKPGMVEVDPGDINQILAETEKESQKLQDEFCVAMSRGAARVVHWLQVQEDIRRDGSQTVQDVYREAQELNHAMQAEARRAAARLILIKASATITLKTAALFAGGLPSFLIGTGYDVSLDVIKNWDKAPEAIAVGVEQKVEDKVEKKIVKDAAKNLANIYQAEGDAPARKAEWLRKRLAEMEEELEKEASAKRLAKYAKDGRKLARAEAAASQAKWAGRALSTVKLGFFAWDMVKVAKDVNEGFHDAGYDSVGSALRDAF
jgi:hypothetical protein